MPRPHLLPLRETRGYEPFDLAGAPRTGWHLVLEAVALVDDDVFPVQVAQLIDVFHRNLPSRVAPSMLWRGCLKHLCTLSPNATYTYSTCAHYDPMQRARTVVSLYTHLQLIAAQAVSLNAPSTHPSPAGTGLRAES